MKSFKALGIILLICLFFKQSQSIKEEGGVFILTDSNFDSFIAQHPFALVEFYAPWCGHCKKLVPEFEGAATTLKEEKSNIVLAKVDATEEKKIAEIFEVKSYPTLKFFSHGVDKEYQGGRTSAEIVKWLQASAGKQLNISEFKTQEELEELKKNHKVFLTYFGNHELQEQQDSNFKLFNQLASILYTQSNDLVLAYTYNHELKVQNKVANDFVIFKQFDEKRNDYQGKLDAKSLKAFVEEYEIPTIMPFDLKARQKIFNQKKTVLTLLVNDNEASTQAASSFDSVKDQLKGKILLIQTQIKEGLGGGLGKFLNIKDEQLPKMAIISVDGKKYFIEKPITAENILEFFKEYESGKAEKVLNSEEIPEKNDDILKVLVGKSFEQIVYDKTKDVFIMFHSPNCGHCKNSLPIFKQAAQQVNQELSKDIIFAIIDSTKNDVKGIEIDSFPQFKFFPSNNKQKPINYDSDRTIEEFINFVTKHKSVSSGNKGKELKEDL